MPQIPKDWLNPKEQKTIDENNISEEVNMRLRMEQNTSTEDQIAVEHDWNHSDTPNTHDAHVPDAEELSNPERESNSEYLTPRRKRKPTLRKQHQRRLKEAVNYKGMFPLFEHEYEVDLKYMAEIFEAHRCFLSTFDMEGKGSKSTPATRALDRRKYLSIDEAYEDVHPLTF